MKKSASLLVLLLVFSFILVSHPEIKIAEAESDTMWNQSYGGTNDEEAFHLVETSDGGYAIAGYTLSFGAGFEDFWLVKTDEYGNMEWNQTYGGPYNDRASSLVEVSDGGFVLSGYTRSYGAGSYDFWLVKVDSSGNLLWNKTYGGPEYDLAYSLVETSDGGYAIAGYTISFGAGRQDFWLVKTDEYGNMEWNQTYGSPDQDSANSLVETSDGGYAMAGSSGSGLSANFWLVKTNNSGNMEWNQTYGGSDYDFAHSLVETSDGGFAIVGYTGSFGAGNANFWLVKTDGYGNMEWNQTYGIADYNRAYSLVQTSDGGLALAGSSGSGFSDFWLIKTDEYGKMEWNQTYSRALYDRGYSLVETSDGGYALAGYTRSGYDDGTSDFWLIKTDKSGIIPEFPSWTPMLIMLVAVLAVAVAYKRKIQKQGRRK